MHTVLRPPEGRHNAGMREGVPHGVDPIRPCERAARARAERLRQLHERGETDAYLYGAEPSGEYTAS